MYFFIAFYSHYQLFSGSEQHGNKCVDLLRMPEKSVNWRGVCVLSFLELCESQNKV